MSGKAAKIRLTEGQTAILQQIIRSMTAPQRLVQRARLIVLAFGGMFNGSISGIIGLRRKQVGLWRRRWKQSFDALVAIECRESRAALRRAIEEVLGDAPRSGSFGKFTAEQVTQVLAVACEPADQSGRPIDEWTGRELADELVQRGIVASISASQVNRYLAAAELQPHRSKYWLNTTEKDPQLFAHQVQVVCQCYLEAPQLYFQHHTHTISVDEMTGVQALERNAKTVPMKPGQPAQDRVRVHPSWHRVLDRELACRARTNDRAFGRCDADRGGFLWAYPADGGHGWGGRLGVCGQQSEHALQREPGAVRRAAGGDRPEHVGPERQVRHSEVDGQSSGLPFRP